MPTYEYQCQDCGHKVEYFQPMSEPPRTVCPRCQGRLSRLISGGVGLIFKGSGFYITDYKRKNNGGAAKHTPKKSSDADAAPKEKAPASDKSSD